MKVMITAGSTVERIDRVRSISNISTGKLGSLIADAFSSVQDIEEIYYLCNKTAILPRSERVTIITIDNVTSLESVIKDVCNRVQIDIVIHSMAVSDYCVNKITSVSIIAKTLAPKLDLLKDEQITETALLPLLYVSIDESSIDDTRKISSNIDDMLLFMRRTPKVISIFQNISPKSILVGFKLLDTVPHEVLIDTGFHVLQENKCNFVLANDLSKINEKSHVGYLIDGKKNYQRLATKKEIANAIVNVTIAERKKQK